MNRHLLTAALFLLPASSALAQNGSQSSAPDSPPVAFPQVTAVPTPLASTSGRFSSLNPPRQSSCQNRNVVGRVVSIRLIQLDRFACLGNEAGLPLENVLMNVRLGDPAEARQMAVGRRISVEGNFRIAQEPHGGYLVFFLIAEKARLAAGDPLVAPAPASTSYMMCQPPELDALANQLGRELCVQSTVMADLKTAGPALEKAARALVQDTPQSPPRDEASGIACREDRERSDAHLATMACARDNYWAWWSTKRRLGQNFTKPAPP